MFVQSNGVQSTTLKEKIKICKISHICAMKYIEEYHSKDDITLKVWQNILMMERSNELKRTKKRKWSVRALAAMLIAILAVPTVSLKTHAEELTNNQIADVNVSNKEVGYSSSVRPLTTMVDCEITMAFTLKGLEMSFTTLSVEVSSVIGVKDIKVQQKMWYGWKTVMTSNGGENQNEDIFVGELIYPDAVNGKTYRVICTHYANYDVYEEVENDTGAFKFVL